MNWSKFLNTIAKRLPFSYSEIPVMKISEAPYNTWFRKDLHCDQILYYKVKTQPTTECKSGDILIIVRGGGRGEFCNEGLINQIVINIEYDGFRCKEDNIYKTIKTIPDSIANKILNDLYKLIVNAIPVIDKNLSDFPTTAKAGEQKTIKLKIHNTGDDGYIRVVLFAGENIIYNKRLFMKGKSATTLNIPILFNKSGKVTLKIKVWGEGEEMPK